MGTAMIKSIIVEIRLKIINYMIYMINTIDHFDLGGLYDKVGLCDSGDLCDKADLCDWLIYVIRLIYAIGFSSISSCPL